jgi:hypothetical protein
MSTKYCPGCKRKLELFYFGSNKGRADGVNCYCRLCFSFVKKLSAKRNRARVLKNRRDWSRKNKDKVRLSRRKTWDRYKYDFNVFVQYLHKRMRQRIRDEEAYKGLLICDKEDFIKLAKNSNKLKELFDNWVNSGNQLWIKPSVDRIVNERGYILDNIQFMTWIENTRKS